MKCPRCKHEWEPRSKLTTRRAIEDREIDKELGISEDEYQMGSAELGGMRGALPGHNFVGRTGGSDDWDESEIMGER